jgi:hypothetical protein
MRERFALLVDAEWRARENPRMAPTHPHVKHSLGPRAGAQNESHGLARGTRPRPA